MAKNTSTAAASPASSARESGKGQLEALRVVARPPTFRRAGHEFGPEAKVIPLDELSAEQVKAIEEEPELVTTRVVLPAEDAASEATE